MSDQEPPAGGRPSSSDPGSPGRGPGPTGGQVGVLVMAYGSPASLDDVETYYTHIRRGRPPEPTQLADLIRRYDAIGGVSPLRARTEAQAAAIGRALDGAAPGRFRVTLGMKHTAPFVEDAVHALADDGVERIVGLVLAPHYSGGSVGQYLDRAAATATERHIDFRGIESWHLEPAYVDFLADAVTAARAGLPERHKVVFSAHSLPLRVLDGDPYLDNLEASAAAVAARVGLDPFADWGCCFQSAGRTPDPWAGPDILDVIADLAATGRADAVLVCPQGFVSDHLEVRYDLDIEARAAAGAAGLAFARTATVNDDPAVMTALARRVIERADERAAGPTTGAPT